MYVVLDGPFFPNTVHIKHKGMRNRSKFCWWIATAVLRICWVGRTIQFVTIFTNLQGLWGGQEQQRESWCLWFIMYPSYGNRDPYCAWQSSNPRQVHRTSVSPLIFRMLWKIIRTQHFMIAGLIEGRYLGHRDLLTSSHLTSLSLETPLESGDDLVATVQFW